MMTEYIVLEQIHKGNINWDDRVKINDSSIQTERKDIDINTADQVTVRICFMQWFLHLIIVRLYL